MEWVKTTAKTVPEAIDLALDNLGVDEAEAEIVVVEEPSRGLFGRMRGAARVEARIKPRSIRPKVDRSRKRRDKDRARGDKRSRGRDRNNKESNNGSGEKSDKRSSSMGNARSGGDTGQNQSRSKASSASRRSNKGGSDRGSAGTRQDAKSNGRNSDDSNSSKGKGSNESSNRDSGSNSSGNRRRGKRSGGKSDQTKSGKSNQQRKPAGASRPSEEETPVQEVADHLKTFLGGLTDAFGLEGDVLIDDSEPDSLVATVDGQHGLMVGPKGRTLDAIQELARVSAQRSTPSSIRIKVDVGGYRRQRAEALENFARKAADKAADNGTEVALDPMTPADRKIIHDALNGDNRVETRSVGNEPRRKVLVVPVGGGSSDEEE